MKILLTAILFFSLLLPYSCSNKNSYTTFYKEHKKESRVAISIPKWLVKSFIPKEEKQLIENLTKGMRNIKLLYSDREEVDWTKDLNSFVVNNNYKEYVYVKKDGTRMGLYTRENESIIKEIVLVANNDGENVIISLQGNMVVEDFKKNVGPHLVDFQSR